MQNFVRGPPYMLYDDWFSKYLRDNPLLTCMCKVNSWFTILNLCIKRQASSEDSIKRRHQKIWMEHLISALTIKGVFLEKHALIKEDCMEYMRLS
jgi:hypothetical protein